MPFNAPIVTLVLAAVLPLIASEATTRVPPKADFRDTAEYRRLNKKVLDSRLLDDMETLETWSLSGQGEMTLTGERRKSGAHSLRIRFRTRTPDDKAPEGMRDFGTIDFQRRFPGENWTNYNRISVWIYAELPGWHTASIDMSLHNEPDIWSREAWTSLTLTNHAWNHVVWEIPHLPRNKVIGVQFRCRRQGNEPEAADALTFDLDRLELQRVTPDHFEGWNVAPGQIAYSHSGYEAGARKTAITSDAAIREFRVVREDTDEVVLAKFASDAQTTLGSFQVLDFSELREPGTYVLKAGPLRTAPFRIGDDVWKSGIGKMLDYFYAQRCGVEVPGVHRACHRDWQVRHGDKRIVINGGWHDAGDLSQVTANTAEAVYAMFDLLERLRARQDGPELQRRALEEGKVGLAWLLKTSFGDGYRVQWSCMNIWTDGILGNNDDIVAEAENNPFENFIAASAEARAARVLRETDPQLAAYSLKRAVEDWQFAVEGLARPLAGLPMVPGTWITETLVLSTGVQASMQLYRATGDTSYSRKALELAPRILAAQQRTILAREEMPVAGFFYETAAKERILHYFHRAHDQAPIAALAALCAAFPDHPDWMKWYAAVASYSEYMKAGAAFSAPYHMLANSIYRDDEYLKAEPAQSASYRRQIQNGIGIAPGYHLRRFPVWFGERGNDGVLLSQAKALAIAARLRGNLTLAQLAQQQMEWTAGRNPFAESIVYGEGHGYAPHYTAMSGQIVGSLPVGIETHEDKDIPYWPDSNYPTWKETWTHASSRWLFLGGDMSGSATVAGHAAGPVVFRDLTSGHRTTVHPDYTSGAFRAHVTQGEYEIQAGAERTTASLLPGGFYDIDLRSGRNVDFRVEQQSSADGEITLKVVASGTGRHRISIRTDNLDLSEPERDVDLNSGSARTISWRARVRSTDAMWIALILLDGDLSRKIEVFSFSDKANAE